MRACCSVFPHHRRVPLSSRLISRTLVNSLRWVRNHKRGAALQDFLGVDNYNVRFDTSPMSCAHPKMKAGCGCSLQGCTSECYRASPLWSFVNEEHASFFGTGNLMNPCLQGLLIVLDSWYRSLLSYDSEWLRWYYSSSAGRIR